jgi:ribosome-associated protein
MSVVECQHLTPLDRLRPTPKVNCPAEPLGHAVYMNDFEDSNQDEEDFTQPSKTRMKKDALALQELAVHLTTLNPEQLAKVPIPQVLAQALEAAKTIKKREALRRHYQFLGKVMRSIDHQAIAEAVDEIKIQQDRMARLFHVMEAWRDELIAGEGEVMERFIEEFPATDRQQFRSLVRSAKGALNTQHASTHARKLFRFIRDVMSDSGGE